MNQKLMQVSCDPKCGFMIKSHDEQEIVKFTKDHAKKSHKMDVSEKDIKGMMKAA